MKGQSWLRLFLLLLLVGAVLTVFPIHKGILFSRDVMLGLDLQGGVRMVYQADLSKVSSGDVGNVLSGVVSVISNRVNPLGVSEPQISRQGADQIVVELPGVNMSEEQKARIGRTALLQFREQTTDAQGNTVWVPVTGTVGGQTLTLDSSYFKDNTFVGQDPNTGQIVLVFEWNDVGAQLSEQITTRLVGKQLGIFEGDEPLRGASGQAIAPVVEEPITTRGQITGLSVQDANQLSKQLNAGRLPVPLTLVYEQDVSPVLGADFVTLAVRAGVIGLALVMLFMILYYRLPGAMSALALAFYALIVLAIFKLLPVTLTLAGIAGFIVSLGMAVDANVLIFERLREELKSGRTLGAGIEAGFNRAWSAIWDSNLTTFISCGVLYWVGSLVASGAALKGFALTLAIGVAVSMFTAITVTRTLLRLVVGTALAKNKGLYYRLGRVEHV